MLCTFVPARHFQHAAGRLVDRGTQAWVRTTGRWVTYAEHPWLRGPVGEPGRGTDSWLATEAGHLQGVLSEGGGLLGSMSQLAGGGFDPSQLSPAVVDFYQGTSAWRMEVLARWCPAAWPFGWLVSAVFARRLQQLALPLRPRDTALGMISRVVCVRDADGRQLGAAWLRTLRSNGQTVYSGWYGVASLPGRSSPSLRVVFPLPNGNLTVFLSPEVGTGGSLRLVSPPGVFGDAGAYLTVAHPAGQGAWARRVPIYEELQVYQGIDGALRTDHSLRFQGVPVLKLHYRLEHMPGN